MGVDENTNPTNAFNLYKTDNTTVRITGLQAQSNATIKMYDITGKQVMAKKFVAQPVKDIALPNLATGVYIVNVVSDKMEYTKKLLIE